MSSGKKPKIVVPPAKVAEPIQIDLGTRGGEEEQLLTEEEKRKRMSFERTLPLLLGRSSQPERQDVVSSGRLPLKTLLG